MVMPGDLNNADAVMQVSIAANRKVYDLVKEDYYMCEALRELMKDEIDREKAEAREKAMEEAREKEISLISNLMETMKFTAEQAMNALKIPAEERQMYASRLAK
jgi:phosphosulfolactate phosphohydrolase-like enzyme